MTERVSSSLARTVARRLWLAAGLLVTGLGAPVMAGEVVDLPKPRLSGQMSLEQALAQRRSQRRQARTSLSREQIGQLLWAAQGVTDRAGHRTAPSAGALYPLEIYVATNDGVFRYVPARHALERSSAKDLRASVPSIYARPGHHHSTVFIVTANYARTRPRYGASTERFVHLEAGHAGQNLLLQATALGLYGVPVGAFDAGRVKRRLGLKGVPIYVILIGHPPGR